LNIWLKHYTNKKNDKNIFFDILHFRNLKLIFLFYVFNHIMNNNSQQSTNKKNNDKNKNIFKIDCYTETNKKPENMSIAYNQEISNLEFSNELGDKNLEQIKQQIQELYKQQKYIEEMKINNKLSLSILYQKQKQENIDIKFLPFLPKEVNNLIRNKLSISKYEVLDNIYENMIKDWIYMDCYEDTIQFLNAQLGDQIAQDYNRTIDGAATWRMYWVNENTKIQFNMDTKQFNYEVLKDYKFSQEDKEEKARKILTSIKFVKDFDIISQRLFDPQGIGERSEYKEYLSINAFGESYSRESNLNQHFTDWNKVNMTIYLMKNIDKILKYWVEVEMEYLALLNKILKKMKTFYDITDKTKYWNKMRSGEYTNEELMDKIYYSYDNTWRGVLDNEKDKNGKEKIEKYCMAFIDKKIIPVINKNGKLTNKTNYQIMGYDIIKYLDENTIAKKFDPYLFEMTANHRYYYKFMNKYHFDYNYLAKIFKQFYITKSSSFREHIEYNNLDIDYEEMRKMISICHNNGSGVGEDYDTYCEYMKNIRESFFTNRIFDYSEHLFRKNVVETIDKCYTLLYTKI